MDTKLTLKLDREVIEKAKLYAKRRGESLSKMVENYLLGLTREEEPASRKLTGVVAELAGLLAGKEVDASKEARAEALTREYVRVSAARPAFLEREGQFKVGPGDPVEDVRRARKLLGLD